MKINIKNKKPRSPKKILKKPVRAKENTIIIESVIFILQNNNKKPRNSQILKYIKNQIYKMTPLTDFP